MHRNRQIRCDFSAPQQIVNRARGQETTLSCYRASVGGTVCQMEVSMPLRPANSPLSPAQSRKLDWYLASTGLGCNPSLGRAAREAEYARLDALPDGALRSMGLSRPTLPAFVYRDLFHTGAL